MDDSTTSMLSAVAAGVLVGMLCVAWSRWTTSAREQKSEATLMRENRLAILASHICLLSGLVIGVSLCAFSCAQGDDWGGLILGVSFGCVAPIVVLPVSALAGRRSVKGALAAYEMSFRMPSLLFHAILITASSAFFWALRTRPC